MNRVTGDLVAVCCILNYGKGSKALGLSKQLKTLEGTVFLGKGTVKTEWLNVLGITDARKEIFITIVDKDLEDVFYDEINRRFALSQPHNGIAFSMPVKYGLKTGSEFHFRKIDGSLLGINPQERDVTTVDYESIFIIVNKGLAQDVLEAAESGGSTGGTVIHGRGSGTQEKALLFNIEIEPEKDIILILSEKDKTNAIVDSIAKRLDIEKPNAGVIFVADVTRTLGLYRR